MRTFNRRRSSRSSFSPRWLRSFGAGLARRSSYGPVPLPPGGLSYLEALYWVGLSGNAAAFLVWLQAPHA